ncbi:MAG: phosphoethanolamine--lipid A transferase [Gammaproteobacteria bacterium]|nr:phosphoethanolamine--lipid A transferase [Gammaproteobacteria bacterium]
MMSTNRLILATALLLSVFFNLSFFRHAAEFYPPQGNPAFIASLFILLTAWNTVLLGLVAWRPIVKPMLVIVLLASALTAYFMDAYDVVISDEMIQNLVETDVDESMDLFSVRLLIYLVLLGIVPSLLVYRVKIDARPFRAELLSRLKLISVAVLTIVAMVLAFGKTYSSLIREHKTVRFYANPAYYLYSAGKYLAAAMRGPEGPVVPVGTDAEIPATDQDRELVVLVVGESARADHFSLNGYARDTNPLLAREDVIYFSQVHSCGTSTAVSVPCMFSLSGYAGSEAEHAHHENLLDVLTHAGVNVLWRDNNSDSKGVALRVPYENFKTGENNPVCDVECRDVGMLAGLQEYIDGIPQGDIVIVLHQMGNHGPAYYKRYPREFERFTPVCATNELDQCSGEEIGNAYDNAILYTDYFLSRVIGLLKQNTDRFETAMMYVSDHGESLGEKGLYLHGIPMVMAPEAQTHVPMILWFGDSYHVDRAALRAHAAHEYTHDNLFHTMLGLVEIESQVYRRDLDLVNHED